MAERRAKPAMRFPVLAVLVPMLAAFAAPAAAQQSLLSHWVQLNAGGRAQVRVVTDAAQCPQLELGNRFVAMTQRGREDGAFPVHVCAAPLPAGIQAASVDGVALPLPKTDPRRIVVFGDTGCRIKGGTIQDCNDPAKWPFPEVARMAAAEKPDLLIHAGDYLYREMPCPPGNAKCAGSPSGDDWPSWAADFFTPSQPLLDVVPAVFVRGNHEDCSRAGPGWLRLLGPNPYAEGTRCTHLPPYAVPLGAMTLAVFDDADAPDTVIAHDLLPQYRSDFAAVAKMGPGPVWLAMHRPLWGAVTLHGITVGGNRTLIAALDRSQLSPVTLMLAGHIHRFEVLNYTDPLPPQIIAGYGGDLLDSAPPDLSGINISGETVKDGISVSGFGYLVMVKDATGWQLNIHGANGALERQCHFAGGRIDCP